MKYNKVSTDMNFQQREKHIMEFWKNNDIVQKSFKHREGNESFVFYDGPPTANGMPHIGHVVTRAIKDLIPRFHTMKGKDVLRKAGWDTHGLPVELEVEKTLKLNGKPEIEAYGIENFIKQCKKSVWKYLKEWEDMSERVAYWVDMDDPYITYEDKYIESIWWSLKEIDKKGLLYKGNKVVPYCPRCGTALSSHEVAQGYKEVVDTSAFVAFSVKDEEDTYFLAWTTTPWTLPSNVGLCVNPKEKYAYVSKNNTTFIVAEELKDSIFAENDEEYVINKVVLGKELEYKEYMPLYTFGDLKDKAWYIVCDDYVSLTEGTGIVHIAPAFGEDDARIAQSYNLPFVQLVDDEGKFVEITPWNNLLVQDANPLVLKDLDERNLLFKTEDYPHNYPFCWRCDTALLYYARSTWFIKMTAVKDLLVANNKSINWIPDNIKEGRMGNFLENVLDWGLSRERYWGTPLPIWICEEGHRHVVGSKKELHDMSIEPFDDVELHRPYIDEIILICPKCKKNMNRVTEVIDGWYDSGAMPFAQWNYPFSNKEIFEKRFPANFISEAVDQTRGWFYTLLAISTVLFEVSPYKNCVVLGHVQDKEGQKMSKHKGNVVDPWDVLNTKGADSLRWYFYRSGAPWLPSKFSLEAVEETQRKFMGTLQNVYAFFVLYANIDDFDPKEHNKKTTPLSLMDRWIISKMHTLIKQVDDDLNNYRIPESARAIEKFVDDLSNWYVRRSRERFWGKGMEEDKVAAFTTLHTVLENLSKLLAPYIPFIAEDIFQNLVKNIDKRAPESVHLSDFPSYNLDLIDKNLEKQMDILIEIVQLGRAGRNLSAMKVRQPLATLYVKGAKLEPEYIELAKEELNIKNIVFVDDSHDFITYSLKPQLRTLGPKYGKLLNKIRDFLTEVDGDEVVNIFSENKAVNFTIDGTKVSLEKDDVIVTPVSKPGFISQSDDDLTVVLDTNLNSALIEEGYAREIISKIQTMRKEANFDVSDRIKVSISTQSDKLKEAFLNQSKMIKDNVLGLIIGIDFEEDNFHSKKWDINGESATIAIKKYD